MLVDGRLESVVDVAEPVAQDVAEANQDRQADAAQLQVIDELFEVDGPTRLLGRMREHMPVGSDGKITLTPAVHLIQLGGIGDGPWVALLSCPRCAARRTHVRMIQGDAAFVIVKIP